MGQEFSIDVEHSNQFDVMAESPAPWVSDSYDEVCIRKVSTVPCIFDAGEIPHVADVLGAEQVLCHTIANPMVGDFGHNFHMQKRWNVPSQQQTLSLGQPVT